MARWPPDLPDYYATVAADVLALCRPSQGMWVDLGSGTGGVALALAPGSQSAVVMVDPNGKALVEGMKDAHRKGLDGRAAAVIGQAEGIPLADACADMVVSRGSVFFWQDRPAGLREVHRILRPGGKAIIGGGLGSTYPLWARQEFTRRRLESIRKKGPEAERKFREVRRPETFTRWATQAGLSSFRVKGEGGLPPADPRSGLGIWLLFSKNQ